MRNTSIMNNATVSDFIQRLKNSSTQYPVLDKEEERALIEKYKDTDLVKLRQLLVMHNIRAVFNIAKKYCLTSVDFDELVARGMEGLSVAASKFDFDKGTKFITYATPWIFKYISQEFYDKDVQAFKTGIPLESTVGKAEDNLKFENVVDHYIEPTVAGANISCDIQAQMEQNEMRNLYDYLSDYVATSADFDQDEKYIYSKSFIDKNSLKTISDELHIPYQIANKKKKAMLAKLRQVVVDKFKITSLSEI